MNILYKKFCNTLYFIQKEVDYTNIDSISFTHAKQVENFLKVRYDRDMKINDKFLWKGRVWLRKRLRNRLLRD